MTSEKKKNNFFHKLQRIQCLAQPQVVYNFKKFYIYLILSEISQLRLNHFIYKNHLNVQRKFQC